MGAEKRKYLRSCVSFPIECSILSKHSYFYTVSKDVSAGGVRILSDDFLPKNNYLKLNINLIDKVVGAKAKVIWCSKERVSDRYYAGLEFTEIGKEGKELLNSIAS